MKYINVYINVNLWAKTWLIKREVTKKEAANKQPVESMSICSQWVIKRPNRYTPIQKPVWKKEIRDR